MKRYPRLTAHLICESKGWLTPISAGEAIADHANGIPHVSEWYTQNGNWTAAHLLAANRAALTLTFQYRRTHRCGQRDYRRARRLVESAVRHCEGLLNQSWQESETKASAATER